MPSIEKVLRSEILRLAKKEAKAATADLRKTSVSYRKTIADLRRRVDELERENKQLVKQLAKFPQEPEEPVEDAIDRARITAKMIKSIRSRLGLSQAKFAKLVGVAQITVSAWEQRTGRLKFKGDTKSRIIAARAMTKKEAAEKLAQ